MAIERRAYSFQSHAGSIEAYPDALDERLLDGSFNPTLVRLRPDGAGAPSGLGRRFNPTLVRLRRKKAPPLLRSPALVSIPRWFD